MSAYIKLSTLEYPRHVGDIAIDPDGESDYANVEWVDPPVHDIKTQLCMESTPEQIDGVWRMTWTVRSLTQEEIQNQERRIELAKKGVFFDPFLMASTIQDTTPPVNEDAQLTSSVTIL